jgi:hypothetical protein
MADYTTSKSELFPNAYHNERNLYDRVLYDSNLSHAESISLWQGVGADQVGSGGNQQ